MTKSINFLPEWRQRNLLHDISNPDELSTLLDSKMQSAYVGFDPTADSLHIGNLLPLLALKRLQLAGHRPIVLVGGGTGLIGDPAGKKNERSLNMQSTVEQWSEKIKQQTMPYLDYNCGANSAIVLNNFDWLSKLGAIELLRDIGKEFPLGGMLAKETVKSRLGAQGISYTEFSYMILQAYDFLWLYRNQQCAIQIGGSDQWGNITAGMELIRRLEQKSSFAITLPLVTRNDGEKFGKTQDGAVWLAPDKTNSYQLYQFWLNCADGDIKNYLNFFSFLDSDARNHLLDQSEKDPAARHAQKQLAYEICELAHGKQSAINAKMLSEALFLNDFSKLTDAQLQMASAALPSYVTNQDELNTSSLINLLCNSHGSLSKRQAKQWIEAGAILVNAQKVQDATAMVGKIPPLAKNFWIITRGKKHHTLIVCEPYPIT